MDSYQNERRIVNRIINGKPDDFRIIIAKYKNMVAHLVYRLVDNEADREELGQDIFLKIYHGLPSFKFKSNLATWITRITYNTCQNYLRKRKMPLYEDLAAKNGSNNETTGDGRDALGQVLSENPLQDEMVMRKQLSYILLQEINRLPEQYRKIITLYHLDNINYREIGKTMDLPEGTVKNYIFRARKLLKDRLLAKFEMEELCL